MRCAVLVLVLLILGCVPGQPDAPEDARPSVLPLPSPPVPAPEAESHPGSEEGPHSQTIDEEEEVPRETPMEEPGEEQVKLSFEEQVWKKRIDAALAPSDCAPVSGLAFGDSYKGRLIDTHYHIANIPDSAPGEDEEEIEDGSPVLGQNIRIADTVCTLEQENTAKVFAFFPVYPEIPAQMVAVAQQTLGRYSETFVPFIMPPDHDDDKRGSPTVTAAVLRKMLAVSPGLFRGYGEIGLYARKNGAAELPPDAQRLLDIYPVARAHHLLVYFHLGEGHKDNFERVLQQNPDLNFIWHGDQLSVEEVEDVIRKHPNAYYTVDELYGDVFLIRPEVTKKEFLSHFTNHEALIEKDLATWKEVIERHPDQFMWGTDRSDQVLWSHDPEVGAALANYGRAFIARLDPAVRKKFAYQNAEHLLSDAGKAAGTPVPD